MNQTKTQKTNQIMLAAVVVMLVLSAFTYRSSITRADRFERGQKFLPTLDVDAVAEIVMREGARDGSTGGNTVALRRTATGDRFVVQSADGYRADNAEVNRLLRKFLDLKLEKEIGDATDSLAEELGVALPGEAGPADGTVEVVLRNAADQDVVRFLVGGLFTEEGSSGRYLRRIGSSDDEVDTIYLTQGRVDLEVDGDSYVDQEILNVDRDEIAAIRGDGFVFRRDQDEDGEYGDLTLEGLAEGAQESSKARSAKGVLSPLRFTQHFVADALEVQGLAFDTSLEIELKDGTGYVVDLAQVEGADDGESKSYLRIRGFNSTEQVYIDRDASEDEVRETSQLLARADELVDFNEYHGSWIYEVTSTVADRVGVEASELVD